MDEMSKSVLIDKTFNDIVSDLEPFILFSKISKSHNLNFICSDQPVNSQKFKPPN